MSRITIGQKHNSELEKIGDGYLHGKLDPRCLLCSDKDVHSCTTYIKKAWLRLSVPKYEKYLYCVELWFRGVLKWLTSYMESVSHVGC